MYPGVSRPEKLRTGGGLDQATTCNETRAALTEFRGIDKRQISAPVKRQYLDCKNSLLCRLT